MYVIAAAAPFMGFVVSWGLTIGVLVAGIVLLRRVFNHKRLKVKKGASWHIGFWYVLAALFPPLFVGLLVYDLSRISGRNSRSAGCVAAALCAMGVWFYIMDSLAFLKLKMRLGEPCNGCDYVGFAITLLEPLIVVSVALITLAIEKRQRKDDG